MAFDEALADRIRDLLAPRAELNERKMLGGIAFMIGGNMAVGVIGEDLMVRLDPAEAQAAGADPSHPPEGLHRPPGEEVEVRADSYLDCSSLSTVRRQRVLRPRLHTLLAGLVAGFALLGWNAAGAGAAGEETAWLFDPDAVVEIDLEMPPSSIDALKLEPDEYQPATVALTAAGQTYGPYEVGARLKGSVGSFRPLPEKAGFKVKFDEYVEGQTFFGLEKLTLNNMVQDPSMIHETLAYELFRSFGVPAPRTGYAFVHLNGDPYGVYLNVETLDLVSLPRWFASTRHLYEGQVGLDVSPGTAFDFEVDEGKSKKREDLEALILAADSNAGDWSDGMAAVADLAEMTRMWAVERYIGHWDGYAGTDGNSFRPNNYYLHSEDTGAAAGRFQMLPWGTDQTWESKIDFDEPAGGLLFNRCLGDADCSALYTEALLAIRGPIAALDLDSRAICTAERLAPWQSLEDPERREYNAAQIGDAVADIRDFIGDRPAELAGWLGVAAPSTSVDWGPCPVPESPDDRSSAQGPASAPATVIASVRLVRVAVTGRTLTARFEVPSAGVIALRTTSWSRKQRAGACSGTAAAAAAGRVTVSCQLPRPLLRRLQARWLRLHVRAEFAPSAGARVLLSDGVHLPRGGKAEKRHGTPKSSPSSK